MRYCCRLLAASTIGILFFSWACEEKQRETLGFIVTIGSLPAFRVSRLNSFIHQHSTLHGKVAFMYQKVKVKCTIVQALRLCTGRTAHRGNKGIALPFHDHGTRRGWGVSVTPQPLFTPRERPGTHCTRGWVGPRTGLDRWRKSRPHQDSIPAPTSPSRVAIPTELSPPTLPISSLIFIKD